MTKSPGHGGSATGPPYGAGGGEVLFKSFLLSAVCGQQVLNHSFTHSFIHPVITFIHSFFLSTNTYGMPNYVPGSVLRALQAFSHLVHDP